MAYELPYLQSEGQKHLFQLIIEAIEKGELSVSYKTCANYLEQKLDIGRVFSTHPGGVVGALMDTLLEGDPNLPLINMLVVDMQKGIPGNGANGYLKDRYKKWFSDDSKEAPERLKLIALETNKALAYKNWRKIYQKHFGKLPKLKRKKGAERDGQGDNPNFPMSGGESEEHKRLKQYICENPELVKVKRSKSKGLIEFSIPSGDRIDVIFLTEEIQKAVEVKSIRSNDDDLRRGLFQCIKYREVLKAQNGLLDHVMNVDCVLVSERKLSSELQTIARRLKVKCFHISVN